MNNKTIIFDFGATLDTNGIHWFYVFKQEHLKYNSFLSDEQLRDAYIYGEQTIAKQHLINSEDNFLQTLIVKVGLQYERLFQQGVILENMYHIQEVAQACYLFAKQNILYVKPMLEDLTKVGISKEEIDEALQALDDLRQKSQSMADHQLEQKQNEIDEALAHYQTEQAQQKEEDEAYDVTKGFRMYSSFNDEV